MNQTQLIQNCKDIIEKDFKWKAPEKILILYDEDTGLSRLLKCGYEEGAKALGATLETVLFTLDDAENIVTKIKTQYHPSDLIILVQSTSFRVSAYRWRNLLCEQGLKVVEHSHLSKVKEDEYQTYIDSLNYDFSLQEKKCRALTHYLQKAAQIKIVSEKS